jgi:acyl-CoA thioester hydrolase
MCGKVLKKEPITDVDIRFQDCDPFGHLNNARYIDYFINTREDHLADHYDLDIYERQKELNISWVVTKTKIAYLSPVIFREQVSIKTSLVDYNGNTLLMEGVMFDNTRKNIKSIIWIEFRHFDLTKGKLIEHSVELMDLFGKILMEKINTESFDARVREIRNLQKK